MKLLRAALAAICLYAAASAASGATLAVCDPGVVDLRGEWGQVRFTVEVAETARARARGLMGRERLAQFEGMLFVFPHPVRARFWMKNTPLSLDMVFADNTGRVTRVFENAVPESLTTIDGGPNVTLVLEISGGMAARIGISPGSELRHPRLDPALAVWPCE